MYLTTCVFLVGVYCIWFKQRRKINFYVHTCTGLKIGENNSTLYKHRVINSDRNVVKGEADTEQIRINNKLSK